ncbi:hypothetical protein [Mycobacterium botniense]|uniref:Uncharacterized protein n=1 Tax=Mycobacterium botniense TaxID=84962 RepID=A0A7I9XY19_9MYCO|nr:hypothetical protein [Mycobacterium botniense]GFG74692.1 hypothetical protein MBOT_20570 [Mycobacterium botniense]
MQEQVSHSHDSFEAARAQAAEYMGFTASERIITPKGEVFEIPNPSLLDDEQLARYDALQLEVESWDREDDEIDENGKLSAAANSRNRTAKTVCSWKTTTFS